MEHNLLIGNILRVYLPITMLVSLTSTVATFINTFLAGIWLSGKDVVAISVPSYLTLFLSVTGSIVATGSSVVFSRYLADGHRDRASNCYSIAVYTALVIGAAFLAVCLAYASILGHGYDTPLSDYVSSEYVVALGISAVPLLLLQIAIMFLRMDGDKYLALSCFFVYIAVDITSVWFIVQDGKGPFGVGISVGIGSIAALLLTPIHHRIKGHNMVLMRPVQLWRGMKTIFRFGFRSLVNRVTMAFRYYFLNVFIVTTGIGVAACLTAQTAVFHFVIAVYTGSAIMSAILCSTFYPQGDRRSICDSVRELTIVSLIIAVAIAILVLILSGNIADLLLDGEDGYDSALWCLRWFALSIPTTTVCMILIYGYQSTKRNRLSTCLIVLRGAVLLVLAVWALALFIGEAAIWTCFLLSDLFTLVLIIAWSCICNRRFPRCIDDIMMLHGRKFETPSLFEGSIHDDGDELTELLVKLEGLLSGESFNEDTVNLALGRIETVIGETIDHGYTDRKKHQIDIVIRNDDGLNIVIKDDSSGKIEVPEGVELAKALDLNLYYINFDHPSKAV